ncbi:ABC-type spermidine/putrescine transport system permease subunit II [Rhizobium laguerreae]|uniref:ABC-type spermidine/putrescine transport system permease subunit II n=1 Tax=Rhizobium laguerreae TaxID=1076926 RepID=A0ABR6GIW9_9HYPH|nr:hypothetical protein [Rhizobium laguerreae]MBB3165796.1 ABC-type spermidine/putrescine transport system permease subunit II [Rhizobium laguerreae]
MSTFGLWVVEEIVRKPLLDDFTAFEKHDVVAVFMAAPILVVVINAFNISAYNAWPPPGLTLSWFQKALSTAGFITGLWRSLTVAIFATLTIILIGIPTAYAISRFRFHGCELLRAILFAPLVVPRVVLGFGLFILFVTTRSQYSARFRALH